MGKCHGTTGLRATAPRIFTAELTWLERSHAQADGPIHGKITAEPGVCPLVLKSTS